MKKLESVIMDCLYSFILVLCILFVLVISIPLCILCTISWALYHLFEIVFKAIKGSWLWILEKCSDIIGDEDDRDNYYKF